MCKQKFIIFYLLFFPCLFVHPQETTQSPPTYFPRGSLILRSNAVPWLMLMPNAGIEYKVSDNVGLVIDGIYARWSLKTDYKYWNVWTVSPQVRYYAGKFKDNYIGGQYLMGEYNLTGTQGNYLGGGLTGGHQFNCSRKFFIDIGLSVGYLYLYETQDYDRKDGIDILTKDKYSYGYWGPLGINVALSWKIN